MTYHVDIVVDCHTFVVSCLQKDRKLNWYDSKKCILIQYNIVIVFSLSLRYWR